MQRCFELAKRGQSKVSPNPMVGCVIVHSNKIIGEGWHQKYGEAHAEVNAIHQVADAELLKEATLYVNLEPCAHFGKTPPCADLIVEKQLKRVVISNKDPNPQVAGKGIEKLKAHGIEVTQGVLEEEGKWFNRRFFTFFEQKRPYIILKWAETADGFVAKENFDSKWISNSLSRLWVHQWRSEEDAILIGKNTAQYDNPQLNVREWQGRNPLRVVIDPNRRLNEDLHLFDQSIPTICYNFLEDKQLPNLLFVKINPHTFLASLLKDLQQRNVQSVLVEGGAQLLETLIKENLWDEARVFKSKTTFGNGLAAPHLQGKLLDYSANLEDTYLRYINLNVKV